ncbi:MAG: MGMT family protein [Raoultibacter sp.]
MTPFSEKVYAIVKQIPCGKVATYGQIARLMGSPRSARYVGFALHGNPEPGTTPCHRVVFKDGSICKGFAFGGPEVQRALLRDEGVTFLDETHVNLHIHAWQPADSLA